ncbi:MAG: hypothetical protein KGS61_08210 [Verrucomicrobia bacterium]|nr:hypothetical protein [Verrucomicrobiota bacterium]
MKSARERQGPARRRANRVWPAWHLRAAVFGLCGIWLGLSGRNLEGAEAWQAALAKMPLATGVRQLDKANCINSLLDALQPNLTVKALVILPGAADELYFFDRVHVRLAAASPSLLDAIEALTNQTRLRASFRPPFLRLHTDDEVAEPWSRIQDAATADRLERRRVRGQIDFRDTDWDHLQPALRRRVSVGIRPWTGAPESWHFYRANLRGWDLNELELLEAVSMATRTWFTVRWHKVIFERVSRNEVLERLGRQTVPAR